MANERRTHPSILGAKSIAKAGHSVEKKSLSCSSHTAVPAMNATDLAPTQCKFIA